MQFWTILRPLLPQKSINIRRFYAQDLKLDYDVIAHKFQGKFAQAIVKVPLINGSMSKTATLAAQDDSTEYTIRYAMKGDPKESEINLDQEWEKYKKKFQKNYNSLEDMRRRRLWNNSVAFIARQNMEYSVGRRTSYCNFTIFCDKTYEEERRSYGSHPLGYRPAKTYEEKRRSYEEKRRSYGSHPLGYLPAKVQRI